MGYVAYKVFKEQAGTLLAGLLGGLISSTATTVANARSTKNSPESSSLAAIAILLASTVSVIRVTIAFAVVSPTAIRQLAPPLLVLFTLMVAVSLVVYLYRTGESRTIPEPENPAELGGAIIFGGLYGLIILAVAATKELMGDSGLYIIAMISGLTDVDAITTIKPEDMNAALLQQYDVAIIGVRAFNTSKVLADNNAQLMEFVNAGGTVIAQYSTNWDMYLEKIGPYNFKITRTRVTDENSPVEFLLPEHKVLNNPNKITQDDFTGWVQERGIYFVLFWLERCLAFYGLTFIPLN